MVVIGRVGSVSKEIKDINAPYRWNMRIWDDDNKEWLCQSDDDNLTYYGFDITGGEVTEFQGLPKWHPDRHLIWEQSTGLKDKNGKEIYEGDILQDSKGECCRVEWNEKEAHFGLYFGRQFELTDFVWMRGEDVEVIGNIHEKPKEFRPEHLKRMGVTMMEGKDE